MSSSATVARSASVAAGATISDRARVGARTVISDGVFLGEDAEVGEDCLLYPHAVVLERCRVGSRCILHPGAVIGSDGFGYVWDGSVHRKVPQVGIVRLEDDVEVGANACVDRATLGETVVGRGTKIDNLVQIGHNVQIGEHSILCGQVGVAGSVTARTPGHPRGTGRGGGPRRDGRRLDRDRRGRRLRQRAGGRRRLRPAVDPAPRVPSARRARSGACPT